MFSKGTSGSVLLKSSPLFEASGFLSSGSLSASKSGVTAGAMSVGVSAGEGASSVISELLPKSKSGVTAGAISVGISAGAGASSGISVLLSKSIMGASAGVKSVGVSVMLSVGASSVKGSVENVSVLSAAS